MSNSFLELMDMIMFGLGNLSYTKKKVSALFLGGGHPREA